MDPRPLHITADNKCLWNNSMRMTDNRCPACYAQSDGPRVYLCDPCLTDYINKYGGPHDSPTDVVGKMKKAVPDHIKCANIIKYGPPN